MLPTQQVSSADCGDPFDDPSDSPGNGACSCQNPEPHLFYFLLTPIVPLIPVDDSLSPSSPVPFHHDASLLPVVGQTEVCHRHTDVTMRGSDGQTYVEIQPAIQIPDARAQILNDWFSRVQYSSVPNLRKDDRKGNDSNSNPKRTAPVESRGISHMTTKRQSQSSQILTGDSRDTHQPPALSTCTMAAAATLHRERQETMKSRNYYSERAVSRPCDLPRRQRSRAIAIKRKPQDQDHEIQENLVNAAEYEWATWRMYNRINDYRQRHPVCADYDTSSPTLSPSRHGDFPPVAHVTPTQSVQFIGVDEALEGEIFDLDL